MTKSLATMEKYAVMQNGVERVNDIIKENLGIDKMTLSDLEKIKVPAGGGLSFEVPTLEGEDSVKNFEGVIIAWKVVRSYFDKPFDGSKEPPLCASDGGEMGYGCPNGEAEPGWYECASCPLNQWDSGKDGVGKACGEKRLLFVVRPEDMLPVVVVAPATSIKNNRQFFMKLAGRAIPYYGVSTQFGLEKAESTNGIKYSKITFGVANRLSEEEIKKFESMSAMFKPYIESYRYDDNDETA